MSKRRPYQVLVISIVLSMLPCGLALSCGQPAIAAASPVFQTDQRSQADEDGDGDEGEMAKQYENDLELVATLTSPASFESGLKPEFSLQVVNRSKSKTRRIVKPGDGSEVGWRPPHVYATAEWLNEKKEWTSCKSLVGYGRCGNYDTTLVPLDLKPGEKFELKDWVPSTCIDHEFRKAGNYRVRWHFDFERDKRKGASPPRLVNGDAGDGKADDSKLASIPDFSLVSKWIELEAQQKLSLELKIKAQGKQITSKPSTTNGYRILDLASIFTANLKNVSGKERELTVPTVHGDARLMYEWYEVSEQQNRFGRMLQYTEQINKEGEKFKLQPDQVVELTGGGLGGNGFGGDWETSCVGKIQIRAMYWVSTWKTPSPKIYSDWVELELPEVVAKKK